jgi:hypothetical protein
LLTELLEQQKISSIGKCADLAFRSDFIRHPSLEQGTMIEVAHHLIREDDLILELTRVQNLGYGSALADLFYLPPPVLAKRASTVLKREVNYVGPTHCGEEIYLLGATIAEPQSLPQQKPRKHKTQLFGALLLRFQAS